MFGSNQWLALIISLIPMALGFALVMTGKLEGQAFMSYCTIATPASIALCLGGSAVTKIFEKKDPAP